ncbi:MAG: DUF1616 domain-containing protein [Candidatus Heimdallarchaeaceae archaeon]
MTNKQFCKFNKERIITVSTFALATIIIFSMVIVFFSPSSQDGFSELSLLTYNEEESRFVSSNYPSFLYRIRNVTVYFMVRNFENKVTYYQLQIKVTKLSQNISLADPLSLDKCALLYRNNTFEKILPPANNREKKQTESFTGNYIWGPANVTLFRNEQVDTIAGGEGKVKLVFELWEFNTGSKKFVYAGIFTFLELRLAYG